MDTRERAKATSRFIILVPHRDSLKPFETYRQKLFASGFCGAYSFPLAAPLASVSRALNRQELKELAVNFRESLSQRSEGCARLSKEEIEKNNVTSLREKKLAKIQSAGTALVHCGRFAFLGSLLDFSVEEALFPRSAREKILTAFSPPALCAALTGSGESRAFEEAPGLSFRAA